MMNIINSIKQNSTCPKCNHNNLGEDRFCEKCLSDLIRLNVPHYHMSWDRVVKGL